MVDSIACSLPLDNSPFGWRPAGRHTADAAAGAAGRRAMPVADSRTASLKLASRTCFVDRDSVLSNRLSNPRSADDSGGSVAELHLAGKTAVAGRQTVADD